MELRSCRFVWKIWKSEKNKRGVHWYDFIQPEAKGPWLNLDNVFISNVHQINLYSMSNQGCIAFSRYTVYTFNIFWRHFFFYLRVKSGELKTLGLLANFLHRKNNITYLGSIKGVRGFTPGRITYILRRKGVWNVSRGKF